ncbi:MAG: RusA family crossover junction endodeoxyribonuclease [Deltaproteobacteria bacterium]|nr:RusA family crossover junction endodeoxyribonuclease [Deltaproteobacteria bacterium]
MDLQNMRRELAARWRGDGTIAWAPAEVGVGMAWHVRVAIPFDYGLSKNAVWSSARGGGHVFMRQRARAARAHLAKTLRSALGERRPVEAKVFVDIFVQKPDQRGDAINVVDVVCDGVKDAVGVDDRWFALRAVDWEVVKSGSPTIWVGVGQVATEHQRICSYCGRALPLVAFNKAKSLPLGVGRECRECRHAQTCADRDDRKRKRAAKAAKEAR